MGKVDIKNKQEIEIMKEGGKKLGVIKRKLEERTKAGYNAGDLEILATRLIRQASGKPSFKMVPGYLWSTCVNVNDGVVHGIPKKDVVFKNGDIVSIDLGMYKNGFHTDTSISLLVGEKSQEKRAFLEVGKLALRNAINQARVGNLIGDISSSIEETVLRARLTPIRDLVGHGIGRELHESPQIPCFRSGSKDESIIIKEGLVLAIEVMYCQGKPDLVLDSDGWTIRTKDGKISGLFEETVAILKDGPFILT